VQHRHRQQTQFVEKVVWRRRSPHPNLSCKSSVKGDADRCPNKEVQVPCSSPNAENEANALPLANLLESLVSVSVVGEQQQVKQVPFAGILCAVRLERPLLA
jgi:hypothetical protein